ncbi:hypothetical protein OG436_31730 [Streptomyces caniferus]|nr:hypothetical protein [Streptomyces caniferus]
MRQHNPDAAMPPDRGSYGIDLSGSNISPLPGLDVMPKAPAMTSIDRLGANTVRVTWKPAADHPDQVLLMERKPFYSSEIGLWHPYTFRHDVQVGATSMDRKLERDSDIPPAARTHAYWIRVVKDGFVSDLRAEKPLTIEP